MTPAIWLITGASSGMGRAMTELVLSHGDIAVATLRKPEMLDDLVIQYPREKLLVLKLDVTKITDIVGAFVKVKDTFGRIDIVFNNAGYGILGEVESTPEDTARAMFETNFWGSMNVARESVKFFRDVNKPIGGRLINITSVAAVITTAGLGYYAASKHAIDGGLESLSKELDPKWNIKITNVQPGGFATRCNTPLSLIQTPVHPAYTDPDSTVQFMRNWFPNTKLPGDTMKAMKVIYHTLAILPDPPIRFPLGKDAISGLRSQAKAFAEDASKHESLSDDLMLEGGVPTPTHLF